MLWESKYEVPCYKWTASYFVDTFLTGKIKDSHAATVRKRCVNITETKDNRCRSLPLNLRSGTYKILANAKKTKPSWSHISISNTGNTESYLPTLLTYACLLTRDGSHQQTRLWSWKESTKCIKSKQNDAWINFNGGKKTVNFCCSTCKMDELERFCTFQTLSFSLITFKISLWNNKVIYNLMDAKVNSLNKAGNPLRQPGCPCNKGKVFKIFCWRRVCKYLGIGTK